jgi:outer membrane protein assembly factor BamD (BamD/ComL family)
MKKIFGILVTIIMASFMVACATPEEKSLRSLQELYEEMELNHENYTTEDWEKAQVEFEVITAQMKLHDYTDEQLREIGKLKGKCSAYLTKGLLKRAEKGFIELGGILEGYLEELEELEELKQMNPDSIK